MESHWLEDSADSGGPEINEMREVRGDTQHQWWSHFLEPIDVVRMGIASKSLTSHLKRYLGNTDSDRHSLYLPVIAERSGIR